MTAPEISIFEASSNSSFEFFDNTYDNNTFFYPYEEFSTIHRTGRSITSFTPVSDWVQTPKTFLKESSNIEVILRKYTDDEFLALSELE